MQQHGRKYFTHRPPTPHPGDEVNRSKFHFFRTRSCCLSLRESRTQEHGIKYFACIPLSTPHPDPRVRVVRSKFNFFRTWSCCKSNLRESKCSNMVSNILPPPPPPTLAVKMSKFNFFRTMPYKIKGNHESSNIVANSLPTHPLPCRWPIGQKSKF